MSPQHQTVQIDIALTPSHRCSLMHMCTHGLKSWCFLSWHPQRWPHVPEPYRLCDGGTWTAPTQAQAQMASSAYVMSVQKATTTLLCFLSKTCTAARCKERPQTLAAARMRPPELHLEHSRRLAQHLHGPHGPGGRPRHGIHAGPRRLVGHLLHRRQERLGPPAKAQPRQQHGCGHECSRHTRRLGKVGGNRKLVHPAGCTQARPRQDIDRHSMQSREP